MAKTVLLVDDDALFRQIIGDGLRAAGYDVAFAADGLEAMERVREAPPDVILLDLIMPKVDGLRTCKLLKQHPEHRHIPVILLTGVAREALKALSQLGAEAAVAKRQAGTTLTEVLQTLRLLESVPRKPFVLPPPAPKPVGRRIVTELLAERQHTQALLAALGEGVVELDGRGRVVYANQVVFSLLERPETAVLGSVGTDLFGPAHRCALAQALEELQTAPRGPTLRLELPYAQKTLGVTLSLLPGSEGPPGGLFVLRDLTSLTRRARSLEALAAVGQRILGQLDLPAVLREIVTRAADLLGAERCGLFRIEQVGSQLRLHCVQAVGLSEGYARDLFLAPGEAAVGKAWEERRPVATTDLLNDPAIRLSPALRARIKEEGIGAVLAVPIVLLDEPFGTLTVYRPAGYDFSPEEVEVVGSLGRFAAIAIQNARLYQVERDRTRDLTALIRAGQAVTASLDLPHILGNIVEAALQITGASIVSLLLGEGEERLNWQACADHLQEEFTRATAAGPLRVGRSFAAEVAARRESRWVADLSQDPEVANADFVARHGIRCYLGVPILAREQVLGVLSILGPPDGSVTEGRREVLESLAAQAGLAIENARLYAETRKAYEDLQAAKDQLIQAETLRALGEMAGGVAHDFNNLLSVILGRAHLLRDEKADLESGLQIIERAALDGAETVRRLLGFARVRSETNDAPVDLAALVAQVLELTRPRWKDEAQRRGAPIEVDLVSEPVPAVWGNAAELREALVNLVFNAVDAMPEGGRLTLGTRRPGHPCRRDGRRRGEGEVPDDVATGSGDLVEVFVQDTGVGMAPEVRRRAFEPFFSTKGAKGTGLGLAMVYGVVGRHGGEVLVESQEGEGTTVSLRLPTAGQPVAERREVAILPAVPPRRIMVVDDEAAVGQTLAELLRRQGHEVESFTDPRRALEHLTRSPVDLLFTDLGMPEMSGWEMARGARELHPEMPIVVVTGWGEQLDPAQVREHCVHALVSKPYHVEDILRLVAEVSPVASSV